MALIHVEVSKELAASILHQLDRIANALDRLAPLISQARSTSPPEPGKLHTITNESLWQLEQEKERLREQGLLI